MSTNKMEALGLRAKDCKKWRWMAGMLASGWRLVCVSLHDGAWSATSTLKHEEYHYPTIPNFDDAATFGCLQSIVEEALGFPVCVYRPRINRDGWLVESAHDNGTLLATDTVVSTRVEALIIVLEAAS